MSSTDKQLAGYAMVFDLIGSLARLTTEEKAIDKILDLCIMIFGPSHVIYLPMREGKPGDARSKPAHLAKDKEVKKRLTGLRDDYAWTESGKGFILRIGDRGKALGILEVDGIAFPEHKEHYLNLALTIVRVLALAISSARNYQSLEDAKERLKEERDRVQSYLDIAGVILLVIGTDKRISLINKKGCQILGCSEQEIVGKDWFANFIPERVRSEVGAKFEELLAEKVEPEQCFENPVLTKSGEERIIAWQNAAVRDEKGMVIAILSSGEDITERKKAEQMLNQMAFYDALTGLPNRILLHDRLDRALAHAQRNIEMLALLYLDLDNFKTINDTLGHCFGDHLLQEVSGRLTACLRKQDTVARLGGDEFVLLLQHINCEDDARKIAEKVLDSLKPPFTLNDCEFYITTSIGISLYPYDGGDAQTLLKNADIALYKAKAQGRGCYQFYTSAMNARVLARLSLENDMRKALDKEEFVLHYQPILDTSSGKVVGLEALLRWQHPGFGLVPPAEFIAIAEETGLIVPIGEWVLKTACMQNKEWQRAGYPTVPVSVNISVRQFYQQDLVDVVSRTLKETGLDPRCLNLEITESTAMQDKTAIVIALRELKDMGIKLSIDDFGTGYSSLAYLKRFPIDKLKIEGIFTRALAVSESDIAIVKAIIAMGHSLNLKIVAEGVETIEQFDILKTLRCDEIQGFLFSKPKSAKEISELLAVEDRLCIKAPGRE